MNKAQLVDEISKKSGLSKIDSKKALDALIEVIKKAMAGGDKIQLTNFGSFSVSERSSRTGRNPLTGNEIFIPKKT